MTLRQGEWKPVETRNEYVAACRTDAFIVPLLKRKVEDAISRHSVRTGAGKALDIGCGSQPFRAAIEKAGYRYYSLDPYQNADGTVDFVCAIDRPVIPELAAAGPFDFLICVEVLEHVVDWKASFANLASLTRPGGRLLLTCPFAYPLHLEPYDFWRPTLHALRRFAEDAGFRVVEEEAAGDALDALGTLLGQTQIYAKKFSLGQRIVAKLARTACAVAYAACRFRPLRAVVRADGYYLANVVLLERA